MNQKNVLSVRLTRAESIAGWIYLPCYLLLLSLLLGFVLALLGYDLNSSVTQARINLLLWAHQFYRHRHHLSPVFDCKPQQHPPPLLGLSPGDHPGLCALLGGDGGDQRAAAMALPRPAQRQ